MKKDSLQEFGTYYLVKALNNCSDETQREVKQELQKIAEDLEKPVQRDYTS